MINQNEIELEFDSAAKESKLLTSTKLEQLQTTTKASRANSPELGRNE